MNEDAPDRYSARQGRKDKAYCEAYDQWVASLSDEEQEQLQALGVHKPHLEGLGAGFSERDPAESATTEFPFDEDEDDARDDGDDREVCKSPSARAPAKATPASDAAEVINHDPPAPDEATETRHDLVRRLIGELMIQDNARLAIECLALASGLLYDGDSLTEIAKRNGVTRAAVSKRCIDLTQALNLKPSRALRSLSARRHYRDARLLTLLRAK